MSTITLFKGEQLNGDKRKYHNDASDLTVDGFDRQMASLNVQGNPWVTYNQAQFRGAQNLYIEGNYPSIPDGKRFTSMKLIKDVDAPRIILFERINFDGPSTDLDEHTTLPSGYKVASYRVRSGAWCLYEFQNMKGSHQQGPPEVTARWHLQADRQHGRYESFAQFFCLFEAIACLFKILLS
uniref:Beta/gamma crystallin 'Greek key' domain-containing protein n=1 Tax=Erpetoichthys calabaricus TaxID=27687 RepID=A0A8C4TEM1_ERPCA